MSPEYGYDDFDDYSIPSYYNRYGDYEDCYGDEYDCCFDDEDEYLNMSDACSSNDCTGLVSHGPAADEELKDFRDIYNFGQPKKDNA